MVNKTFQELLAEDIEHTFLEIEEFASIHTVNGKEMTVLIDDNEVIEREHRTKSKMEGIWIRQKLIYVRAEEFGSIPAVGRAIILDGKTYTVRESTDEQGIYSILMEANRTK